jgi:hypothetical protein
MDSRSTSDQECEVAPAIDYGYLSGNPTPHQIAVPALKVKPKRRGSITKYSLNAVGETKKQVIKRNGSLQRLSSNGSTVSALSSSSEGTD